MNNKIAVVLALADVKYSLNDLEKHYKTFCGLYLVAFFSSPKKATEFAPDILLRNATFCFTSNKQKSPNSVENQSFS